MAGQHPLTGDHILIVEDDYFIASQLASKLSDAGILIAGPTPTVADALARLNQTPLIAGAVLDVILGDELVFSVADELDRRAIPFVFATGFEPDVIPKRHADKIVLRKPLAERSVLDALSQLPQTEPIRDADACRNGILALLSEQTRKMVLPELKRVTLPQGAILELPNQKVSRVYFPIDCVLSVVVVATGGSRIETGLIGSEGLTGAGLSGGDNQTPYELVTQIQGDTLVMPADGFVSFSSINPELQLLAARYARALGVQVSHTALANGRFDLKQRLARWLAMVHDRVPGKSLQLTHDYLSVMLGVRRSSVTNTLHVLEGEHLIRSNRGSIEVRDVNGLVAAAGEAYGSPEAEYHRLMALPFDK
ncbi:helix-turn-helix domain-containing protein [Rhizobium wenxiniae]|uniref:helix-turn-helix domain-containing protein n=1 Tax=Rhizobium wenxiniae TaxID=1737357 RepID=UPI003C18785C